MPILSNPRTYRLKIKVWLRPGHSITKPDQPEYEIHFEGTYRELMTTMWALANKASPEWAETLLPASYIKQSNFHLRGKKAPPEIAKDVERKTARLNAEELSNLVTEALNGSWKEFQDRMNDPRFIETITEAARQWASDCYQ